MNGQTKRRNRNIVKQPAAADDAKNPAGLHYKKGNKVLKRGKARLTAVVGGMGIVLTVAAFVALVKDAPSVAAHFAMGVALRSDKIRDYYAKSLLNDEFLYQARAVRSQRLDNGIEGYGNNLLVTVERKADDPNEENTLNPPFAIISAQDGWRQTQVARLESCSPWVWRVLSNRDLIIQECPDQSSQRTVLSQMANNTLRSLGEFDASSDTRVDRGYEIFWEKSGALIVAASGIYKIDRGGNGLLSEIKKLSTVEAFRDRQNVAIVEAGETETKERGTVTGSGHITRRAENHVVVALAPLATVAFDSNCAPTAGFTKSKFMPGTWTAQFRGDKSVSADCCYYDECQEVITIEFVEDKP